MINTLRVHKPVLLKLSFLCVALVVSSSSSFHLIYIILELIYILYSRELETGIVPDI